MKEQSKVMDKERMGSLLAPLAPFSMWIINPLIGLLICMGTNNRAFTIMAFSISSFGITFLPKEEKLCILYFCVSFTHIFKVMPGTMSLLTVSMLLYVLLCCITTKEYNISFILLLILLLTDTVIAQCTQNALNMIQVIRFGASVLFIYYSLDDVKTKQSEKIMLWFVIGVLFASTMKVTEFFPNIFLYTGEDLHEYRYTGMHGDPNYYVVNVIIAMCILVLLFSRRKLPFVLYIAGSLALIWFSTLTKSKSGFMMLLVPVSLIVYSNHTNNKKYINVLLFFALAYIVQKIITGEFDVFDEVLRRFDSVNDMQTLTTGRTVHWEEYLTFFTQSPIALLIGVGVGEGLVNGGGAHNTYIDLIYYLGIWGTVTFFLTIYQLTRINHNEIKRGLLHGSIWLIIAVMYFFLSELQYFDMPFQITLAIMAWNMPMIVEKTQDTIGTESTMTVYSNG